MSSKRFWALSAALAATALLAGCATVEPWDRGDLAKPQMAPVPRPLARAASAHVHTSREAAAGDLIAAGGGCGCGQ